MKGFIVKDLLITKEMLRTLLIILVIYLLLFIENPDGLSFIPPFMSFYLMLSTFSYDELNKWESYAVTLPNGRRNIVLSKYISTFILVLLSYLLIFILSIGLSLYTHNLNLMELSLTFLVNMGVIMFLLSILYPIVFKFGIEKARIAILGLIVGFVLIVTFFGKLLNEDMLIKIFNSALYVLPFVIIITLILSYLLSLKIMAKKEL